MKSKRPSTTHFSPLQFSLIDSRGRNIRNEPPPVAALASSSRSKMTIETATTSTTTTATKKSNDASTERRSAGSIPRKRKYGYSAAERKQRRRSARKRTVADVDPTGDDTSRVGGEEDTAATDIPIETKDGNNDNGEYRSRSTAAEKENVSPVAPDLKEFDFTSSSCDSIVSDNREADADAADSQDDDDSPVQRRLFVNKKRVLEESDDEEILARETEFVSVKKSVTEEESEEEEKHWDSETTKMTLALAETGSRGKEKHRADVTRMSKEELVFVDKQKATGKATVSKSKSNHSAPPRKKQSGIESDDSEQSDDSVDLNAKDSSTGGSKKKVAPSKAKLSVTAISKRRKEQMDIDSDDDDEFSLDDNKAGTNQSKPASKAKSAKIKEFTPASSRQLARIIADKSAKTKSPYVQEMCARARAALKTSKIDRKRQKRQQEVQSKDDSDDDSFKTAKAVRTRKETKIRSTKRTAATKAKKAATDETDDESEYQPTQEVKKSTRSTEAKKPRSDLGLGGSSSELAGSARGRKVAVRAKNQDDAGEQEQDFASANTNMSTMRVTRSRRKMTNAADDATEKKNETGIKSGRGSRSGPVQSQKSTIGYSSSDELDDVEAMAVENKTDEMLWGAANDDIFGEAFDDDASNNPAKGEDDSSKKDKLNRALLSEDGKSNPHLLGKRDSTISFVEHNTRSISAVDQQKIIADILKQRDASNEPSTQSNSSNNNTRLSADSAKHGEKVKSMTCRLVEAQQMLAHAQEIVVNVKHQLEEMSTVWSKDV